MATISSRRWSRRGFPAKEAVLNGLMSRYPLSEEGYQAAAARLNTPLVEGEESLMVVSGVTGGNRLRELHGIPENVVFLKAYRNVPDIKAAIDETGTYTSCVGIKNCSQSSEIIINDIEELSQMKPDYWTLIISKQASKNGQPKG